MLRIHAEDHFRCTSCGDCCRHWDVTLRRGEADRFDAVTAGLIPAERLLGVVRRAPEAEGGDRLRLKGRDCPSLGADNLCVIHGQRGADQKPSVCRIYPYRFVRTPDGDEVHLSWSCPAVVDDEGPALSTEAREVRDTFLLAVEHGYYIRVPEEVALTRGRTVAFKDVRALLGAFDAALGEGAASFLDRVHAMGAVAVVFEEALGEGAAPAVALAKARETHGAVARENLAAPLGIDRLSRALFKALLLLAQGETARGMWAGALEALRAFTGRATVRLRDGSVAEAAAAARVKGAMPAGGDAFLLRWFRAQVRSLTFFGAGRFGLSLYEGLEFLILSAAVAVYLARARAAAQGRDAIAVEDLKAAVTQLEKGLLNRTDLPAQFGLALSNTATLDLLREQFAAV